MSDRESIVIEVPAALRDFLADVSAMIRAGDDAATIVSDDLLQCERGYGGLRPDGQFAFVFFPAKETRWEFCLLADEIDEIGSGHRATLRVFLPEASAIDPWSLNNLDLPQGLAKLATLGVTGITAQSTRDHIVALLGAPAAQSGPSSSSGQSKIPPWIKYHLPPCQVHFEFSRAGKLRRISFMPRDWKPGI